MASGSTKFPKAEKIVYIEIRCATATAPIDQAIGSVKVGRQPRRTSR